MTIQRVVNCDVCRIDQVEIKHGDGWPGWVQLKGIALDGIEDPNFCPSCKIKIADYIDLLKHGEDR